MANDSMDAFYAYAEQAYVRLQASDVLMHCLEDGSMETLQQIVEGLVLAGPHNLGILREILEEARQRKGQLQSDMYQIASSWENNLKSYGVSLKLKSARSLARLTSVRLLELMRAQGVTDQEMQVACLQLLRESRSLLKHILNSLRLLEDIENYLSDWMFSLAYQSARQEIEAAPTRYGHWPL